jgi:hypothetical protein
MKIGISLVLGFALGFLTYFVLFAQTTTKSHWRVVENYNAFLNDPANYKLDEATGLSETSPPHEPLPDLDALVAAGQLSHVDLVFPNVLESGEATKHWIKFCRAHREIVYITGNPSYTQFKPAGAQPLHLNIWFRDADVAVVQTLIRELEGAYSK